MLTLTERFVVTEVFFWLLVLGWATRRSSDRALPAAFRVAAWQ